MSDTTHDSEPGWSDWSNSARREISTLRETVAVERAQRVRVFGSVAEALERLAEEVRQMAREG